MASAKTTASRSSKKRSVTKRKPAAKKQASRLKRVSQSISKDSAGRLADMLIGAAITLFVVALTTGFHQAQPGPNEPNGRNPQARQHTSRPDNQELSTEPLPANAVDTYVVAGNMPRVISIPSINVKARVLNVGLDKTGAVGTPSSVFDTAWYNGSSLPGAPGAALIDGHVSGWSTPGVFKNLKKLAPGATITIERGDGQLLNFIVLKTAVYPADSVDMPAVLSSAVAGRPGLNLITCNGNVIRGSNEFSERFVVYAVAQ